jgi:hypothetical protein
MKGSVAEHELLTVLHDASQLAMLLHILLSTLCPQ